MAEAWISLHQEDERVQSAKPYIDLALLLMQQNDKGELSLVQAAGGTLERQVQIQLSALKPGK